MADCQVRRVFLRGSILAKVSEKRRGRFAVLHLVSVIASVMATIALSTPVVMAQSETQQIQVQTINIPAGTLGDSLVAVSTAYGVNVLASE